MRNKTAIIKTRHDGLNYIRVYYYFFPILQKNTGDVEDRLFILSKNLCQRGYFSHKLKERE